MPIRVTSTFVMQNAIANAYKATAVGGLLFSTTTPPATGAATGEVASAAYARVAPGWGTAASGVVSASPTFNLASGDAVGAFGVASSTVKATNDVLDWFPFGAVQTFNSNGTFSVAATATAA